MTPIGKALPEVKSEHRRRRQFAKPDSRGGEASPSSQTARALSPSRSTSQDCRPHVVLSRTAQRWRSVRLSHCQRSRSEVFDVVPLWRAAWTRWLSVVISEVCSKALFFALLNGTSISDPEPVNFHATARIGPADRPPPSRPPKDIISARISFPARAAIVPLLDWFPACAAHDFSNPEDPDAPGDDSSFSAVTQQQWRACVCRMPSCKNCPAYCHPPHWTPDSLQERSRLRRTKVVTGSLERETPVEQP